MTVFGAERVVRKIEAAAGGDDARSSASCRWLVHTADGRPPEPADFVVRLRSEHLAASELKLFL